jgi:hypothetical protein
MEEKKFPWLLKLVSMNSIPISILDTFVAKKERIVAIFCSDPGLNLSQIPLKTVGFSTTYGCLKYLHDSKSPITSKKCFFLHKGSRIEVPPRQMKSYIDFKNSIPLITYIQITKKDYKKFLTFYIEFQKPRYKSYFIPIGSHVDLIDKAKELCKYLIGLIEKHENKKVFRMQIEFMVDLYDKLWLSHLDFCQIVFEKELEADYSETIKKLSIRSNSSEILDIINHFDNPASLIKRTSIIKKVNLDKNPTLPIQSTPLSLITNQTQAILV